MTAIAAVVDRRGAPIAAAEARALAVAARWRTDRVGAWSGGPAALAAAQRWTTPGADEVELPLNAGSFVVVFDGILTNGDDLAHQLGVTGPTRDGLVAAAAIQRWGERAAGRLEGAFVLVVWDTARQRLLAIRDHLGAGPTLAWRDRASRLVVGSTPAQVASAPGGSAELDEGMVAELLAGRPTSLEASLVEGVQRLAGGCMLTADRTGVRVRRYWAAGPSEATSRTLDDLLPEVLEPHARLWRPGSLGVQLSGGFDSSMLAAVAAELGGERPPLLLVMDYPPGSDAHETWAWRAVADHLGCPVHVVDAHQASETPLAAASILPSRLGEVVLTPEAAPFLQLLGRAEAAGLRVVWNGQWGDELFRAGPAHLAELAWAGAWTDLWGESWWWSSGPFASRLTAVARGVGAELVRRRRPLRSAAERRGAAVRLPAWIRPELCRRVGLTDRLATPVSVSNGSPHQRALGAAMSSGPGHWYGEAAYARAAERGLQLRRPLLSTSLVHWSMCAAEELRSRRGEDRVAQRAWLTGRLPSAVVARTDKADFGSYAVRAIREALKAASRRGLPTLPSIRNGWVDALALESAVRRLGASGTTSWELFALWHALTAFSDMTDVF